MLNICPNVPIPLATIIRGCTESVSNLDITIERSIARHVSHDIIQEKGVEQVIRPLGAAWTERHTLANCVPALKVSIGVLKGDNPRRVSPAGSALRHYF